MAFSLTISGLCTNQNNTLIKGNPTKTKNLRQNIEMEFINNIDSFFVLFSAVYIFWWNYARNKSIRTYFSQHFIVAHQLKNHCYQFQWLHLRFVSIQINLNCFLKSQIGIRVRKIILNVLLKRTKQC